MKDLFTTMDSEENAASGKKGDVRDRSQNLFSFWFPKVKDCGIKVPQSLIFPTPQALIKEGVFCMDNQREDMARIQEWVDTAILPKIQTVPWCRSLFFVKNGAFSGKFAAERCCFANKTTLAINIANIMYDSLCVGAGGLEEIVIRERIFHNPSTTPCIYKGLPLRPEFRVFYDFDKKDVLYTVNYWDYDTVRPYLSDKTDIIVFEAMREAQKREYETFKAAVEDEVRRCMANVEGMTGAWSVDVMLSDYISEWPAYKPYITDNMYLIDMALAEQSAYWNEGNTKEVK